MIRWKEYFDLNPHLYHSEHRAEYMAAQIAAMLVNMLGNVSESVAPDDFLINSQKQQDEAPVMSDIEAFFIAHNEKVNSSIQ